MYTLKRWVFILASGCALLTFQTEGRAQSLKEKGLKIWHQMLKPNRNLDSAFVYQPFNGWHFSTSYQGRWDNVGLTVPLEFSYPSVTTEATLRVNMIENHSNHVGIHGGYGPITLGYSVTVGTKEKPNRHFSFDWISNAFALQFYYIKLHDTTKSTLEYPDTEPVILPEEPSTANIWRLSGYYFFNHKKFSYPAAYEGKVVQRKSAGSFLVGAKFHHGNIRITEPKSILSSLILNMTGYSTYQFSLGGGYSYNWVIYHRDADSARDIRKLRNLTFNITAIPVLTVVNEMRMTHVIPPNGAEEILPVHGSLQPNALGKVGLCFSFGHFYINSNFDFHYQHFHSKELSEKDLKNAFPDGIDYTYRFSVYGHLFNWTAGVELHYRF